jgi:uncharacterized membrane protein YhaH (DUF805 family)
MQAFRPLQRYFDFSGRSGRAEFWQWTAVSTLAQWALEMLEQSLRGDGEFPSLSVAYALLIFIPTLAAGFRRMHDIGRSALPYLVFLGALTGVIALVIANDIVRQRTGEDTLLLPILFAGIGLAGWAIYTIVLLARPGDRGPNAYGAPDVAPSQASLPTRPLPRSAVARPAPPIAYADALETISRLGALKEQGLLTEEEFATQKARLLNPDG